MYSIIISTLSPHHITSHNTNSSYLQHTESVLVVCIAILLHTAAREGRAAQDRL